MKKDFVDQILTLEGEERHHAKVMLSMVLSALVLPEREREELVGMISITLLQLELPEKKKEEGDGEPVGSTGAGDRSADA